MLRKGNRFGLSEKAAIRNGGDKSSCLSSLPPSLSLSPRPRYTKMPADRVGDFFLSLLLRFRSSIFSIELKALTQREEILLLFG